MTSEGIERSELSLLLVGELNPYGADPRFALYHLPRGASGNRLRLILGLSDVTYHRLLKVNLCNNRFSVFAARTRAAEILARSNLKVLVLLGRKVCDAFGTMKRPFPTFFTVGQVAGRTLIYLPHPSGRCRLWSDESNLTKARALCREHAPSIPWGEI